MGYLKGLFFVKLELIDRLRSKLPEAAKGLLYDESAGWLHLSDSGDPYHLHPGGKP